MVRWLILPGLVLSVTAKKVTTTSTVDVTTSNNSGPSSWTTTDGVDLDRVRTLDASFGKTNASDAWETEPAIIRSLGTPQADGSTSIKHQSIECAVHSWHDFTACSVTCGGGIKTRKHHSTSCPFDVYHQTCCNTQPCEGEGSCAAGSFVEDAATLDLETCGTGNAWGTCTLCAAGTYKDSSNANVFETSACKACPDGAHCATGSISYTKWLECTPGKVKTGATSTQDGTCETCAAGHFKTTTDAFPVYGACAPCSAGSVGAGADQGAAAYCATCPAGRFEAAAGIAKSQCDECPGGEYQTA
jgi:hypothetical protein